MGDKNFDVIRGSLFGGAMGDALGYPVEFLKRKDIIKRYGDHGICKYVLSRKGVAEIFLVNGCTRNGGNPCSGNHLCACNYETKGRFCKKSFE